MEIYADEIVTPRPRGGFIRHRPGLLRIEGSKILSLERPSKSSSLSRSRSVKRVRLVTPGFVDSHTHLVFAGNRADEWNERLKGASYESIASRGGGIKRTVRLTRESSVASLRESAIKRLQSALMYGVTTLEIKSGYGLNFTTEMKVLKLIRDLRKHSPQQLFATFMGAHAVPQEFKSEKDYVDELIRMVLPSLKGLAQFQDVFCERGYFSAKESIRLLKAGQRVGLRAKVHAHEFGRTGGVRVACTVGAVSADHLMYVDDADLRALKKAQVIPVILPGTSFFLGAKRFADARAMLRAGLRVAIGSDFNPGTNPTQNFPLCGTFAAIHQNLDLNEILTSQTYHGALALGLSERGCLEPGFRADFAVWDLESFEEIYYRYGDSRVVSVYIGGRKAY